MKTFIFLSIFSLTLFSYSKDPTERDGGLVGNARFVDFRSSLIGVKGKMPESWQSYDLNNFISINSNEARNRSSIKIAKEEFKVGSLDELFPLLKEKYPQAEWQLAELNSSHGFQTDTKKGQLLFLIVPSGVISIQIYEGEELSYLNYILESLVF